MHVYPGVELEVQCRAVHAHTNWLLSHSTQESTVLFINIYIPIDGHNLILLLLIINRISMLEITYLKIIL